MHPEQVERMTHLVRAVTEWRRANDDTKDAIVVASRPVGSTRKLGRVYDSACKRVSNRQTLFCHHRGGRDTGGSEGDTGHSFVFYESEKAWCDGVLFGDAHAHKNQLSQMPSYMAVCVFGDRCSVQCYHEDARGHLHEESFCM